MGREIISKFREKPKTKTAWRAMWLGLVALFIPQFLGIFAAVIRPAIDQASNENIGAAAGFCLLAAAFIITVLALVIGIKAFKKGERSWVLWLGFVPAILSGAFWVLMIVGELIFPH
ncbi:MAG: hypothetical protein PHE24_05970 [Patescibacteria group bacterium]|nr:hypothetical protein [Patescibacteria group bacterium]